MKPLRSKGAGHTWPAKCAHRTLGRGRSAFSRVVPLVAYGLYAKTQRSIHRRHANCLLTLEAGHYRRPKHRFERHRSELSVERKTPQVCQKNLTCEGFGNELCHHRHLRSVANNPAECSDLRCDVFTGLIRGYTDSRVASDIPKIHRLSVKHARGGAKEDAATLARVQ